MAAVSAPIGRRERNKQAKLERIVDVARELFAERGVDEVTTQQIADKADIGAGTLFLYVKSKGELLLLVQNAGYSKALKKGTKAAKGLTGTLEAVMAVIGPVVDCNRTHIDNGRTYLREMVFGDHQEPYHREALELSAKTEAAIAQVLRRDHRIQSENADPLAHIISAIMFLSLSATTNASKSLDELMEEITRQIRVVVRA